MTPNWEFITRLLVAGLVGGLIGFERELRAKDAGLRTHFLVALGSALFMLISQYAFGAAGKFDASRVAAQVVSGIGFIGAGTIIFQKNMVRGLTTAAGLWVTAALGLACGAGMYWECGFAALLVLIILEAMHFINKRIGHRNLTLTFHADSAKELSDLLETLERNKFSVYDYTIANRSSGAGYVVTVQVHVNAWDYGERVLALLDAVEGMKVTSIE